jgi:hypothetical protein
MKPLPGSGWSICTRVAGPLSASLDQLRPARPPHLVRYRTNNDRLLNGFTEADIGAASAKAHFVRTAFTRHLKMLYEARMASLAKLRCGD